jgi:hypothetical protein
MNNAIAMTGGGSIGFLFIGIFAASWPCIFIGIFLMFISLILGR